MSELSIKELEKSSTLTKEVYNKYFADNELKTSFIHWHEKYGDIIDYKILVNECIGNIRTDIKAIYKNESVLFFGINYKKTPPLSYKAVNNAIICDVTHKRLKKL